MTFEGKIMRKIYGHIRTEDGYWRIKTNQEINVIRFFPLTLRRNAGHGLPILEVSRSHTTTQHSR